MKLVTQALTVSLVAVAALSAATAIAFRPAPQPQEIAHLERVVITGKRMHVEQLPRVVVAGHSVHATPLA